MSDRDTEIATLEQGYREFRDKIAGLPPDAWSEQFLGQWTLSQLLAHMTGWFKEMTGSLERVAKGERPAPEGVDYSATDAWNAKFAATASPGPAALGIFDLRFREYVAAARAAPEELFGMNEKGRPNIGSRLLEGAGIKHFAEHGADLDAWLAGRK